jgi:tetratricopeptide (TPR) repeat protein
MKNNTNREKTMLKQILMGMLTCSLASLCGDNAVAQLVASPDVAETSHQTTSQNNAAYYDLGGFHYGVSTDSEQAQTWFDRGLAMCFAFNHEEAVRCFERALSEDPGMPMALWGMAYAWGPNINNMEIEPHQIAQASLAARLAKIQAKRSTKLERDLIAALAQRYATPVPENREPLNQAYAEAMRNLHKQYPDDSLVATLFADSLMLLRPWKHWSPDGKPAPETPEIVAVLEGALQRWPDHPVLCHLYIHTMEASPTPEKALSAANRLRDAMPGAGHLVHMPSHIDVLLGNYRQVITTNQKAIAADAEFVRREGAHNFYTFYRVHNYHFLVYGALFDGQSELALRTARELVEQVPEDMLKQQTDFLDAFMPTALHVLVRFGRWEDILAEPEPAAYLPASRSVWHYARALAYAATDRVAQAKTEQQSFHKVRATVPATSILFQNTSQDILGVAEAMIAGEIAYRQRDFETAFQHLREAVRRDDTLNYDEPWGWMQPARHALGALLLEQGRVAEGEAVYRADLRRHPNNVWALHGLAECLERQGKANAAAAIQTKFTKAVTRADVKIDRSCYCRTTTPPGN